MYILVMAVCEGGVPWGSPPDDHSAFIGWTGCRSNALSPSLTVAMVSL